MRLRATLSRAGLVAALGTFGLAVIPAVLTASAPPVTDVDIWWVAAAGRRMLADHAVPRINLFSFVDGDVPWVMHEWLFGPPYAAGLERWGPRFFLAVGLASCLGVLALLLAGTVGRARHRLAGALLALVGLLCFYGRLGDVRPLGVAILFPMAVVLLCFTEELTRGRAVMLVACEWIWANAHGSFPLGLALMGASAFAYPGQRKRRFLTVGAAAAATLVNPYGLRLHALVAGYLLGSNGVYAVIRKAIIEFLPLWQVPGFTAPATLFGLALLGLAALELAAVRPTRVHGLTMLALLTLGVLHCRNIEVCGLTALLILASAADRALDLVAASTSPALGRRALLLLAAPAVLGVVAFARRPSAPAGAWVSDELGGAALFDLVPNLPEHARVFAPFVTSGLAIWLGDRGGSRVMYDARNDPYRPQTAWDALTLDNPQPPRVVAARFEKYGVEQALAKDGTWLARDLASLPAWRTLRQADGWTVYARAERSAPAQP